MRAQIDRVVVALCAGRDRRDVIARVVIALGVAAMLWLSACLFVLLEPVA